MQLERRDLSTRPWAGESHGHQRPAGEAGGSGVPARIDLRPLLSHDGAAQMLMLARGQLNRAFRAHGLISPDPMLAAGSFRIDHAEMDDPAAKGFAHARERHGDAFVAWTKEMPASLAQLVLDVLQRTLSHLPDASGEALDAVTRAHEFLLGEIQGEGNRTAG